MPVKVKYSKDLINQFYFINNNYMEGFKMGKLKMVVALLITSVLFAFSCTQSNDKAVSMGKNGDIVKGLYDAFAKGDVPAVLGAFDSGIQWREADGFLYADGNPYYWAGGRG